MSTMSEWTAAVCRELGLDPGLDTEAGTTLVLDVTASVAHGVARPAAPVTAFLIGLAAGRAEDPLAAAREHAERIARMADGWTARATPPA